MGWRTPQSAEDRRLPCTSRQHLPPPYAPGSDQAREWVCPGCGQVTFVPARPRSICVRDAEREEIYD